VKQSKILSVDGIFVALPEKTKILGVLQILKTDGVPPEFLEVAPDGAGVLNTPVNHFLFLIPPDLKRNRRIGNCGRYGQQRNDQEQGQQHIATFPAARAAK